MLKLGLAALLFAKAQSQATPAPVSVSCHDTISVSLGSNFGSDCAHSMTDAIIDSINGDYELACNDLTNDPDCTGYETNDGHPLWYNTDNDGTGCLSGNGGLFYALLVEVDDQLLIYTEYDDAGTCKQATFYFDGSLEDLFTTNPVGEWDFDGDSDDCIFSDTNTGLCDGCAPDAALDLTDCGGFGVSDPTGGMGPSPSPGCETGFGKYSDDSLTLAFCDDGVFTRWGWTNYINTNTNTPNAGTSFDFEIWAGAGQCDTSKGALSGIATLAQDATTGDWEVTINAEPGWSFDELHVHIGDERYATLNSGSFTVAPGKFEFTNDALNDATSFTMNVDNSATDDGEFWIIVHTVSCYGQLPA